MAHQQQRSEASMGPARPLYPFPPLGPGDLPRTVEVVWFAGFAFARAGGHWRLIDATAIPVRETDD